MYGALLGTVDPKNFLFTLTYNFLLIIVLGGMGSITGSMLGAVIVTAGLEFLRVFDEPLMLFGMDIPLFRPGFRMVIFSAPAYNSCTRWGLFLYGEVPAPHNI